MPGSGEGGDVIDEWLRFRTCEPGILGSAFESGAGSNRAGLHVPRKLAKSESGNRALLKLLSALLAWFAFDAQFARFALLPGSPGSPETTAALPLAPAPGSPFGQVREVARFGICPVARFANLAQLPGSRLPGSARFTIHRPAFQVAASRISFRAQTVQQ